MSMREIIWIAVALLAAYAAFELYRALRTGRSSPAEQGPPPAPVATGDTPRPFPGYELPPRREETAEAGSEAAAAGAAARPDAFQTELELRQLRRDVVRLQEEAAVHRSELADMAATVSALKEQLESKLASQNVSPEYNEALVFARRGLDVEAIAERCGISVAEAELVRALAQRAGGAEPGENS